MKKRFSGFMRILGVIMAFCSDDLIFNQEQFESHKQTCSNPECPARKKP